MELKGKTAIITGGASGLGEATVRRFHKNGVNVAIFDLNEERANTVISELGDNVVFFKVNVSDEESVKAAIDGTKAKFGDIHICCNYAGIGPAAKTVGRDGPHPLEAFRAVLEVNLIGTFNVLRLAAYAMSEQDTITDDGQRGVIINTASVAAYEGQIGQAAYSASKGGVVAMTLPAARELARFGIRVNTIAPGLFKTPMMEGMPQEVQDALAAGLPFPSRLGHPEEFGKLVKHMVENPIMNGETVRLDSAVRLQPK